jgi:hypothetical protein
MRRNQGKTGVNSVRMKKIVMAHLVKAKLTAMGIRNSHRIWRLEHNDMQVWLVLLTMSVSRRCALVVMYVC